MILFYWRKSVYLKGVSKKIPPKDASKGFFQGIHPQDDIKVAKKSG